MGRCEGEITQASGKETLNVQFHPDADAELMDAQHWYEQRSDIAARAFGTEVAWAIGQIQDAPGRWKRHLGGTRRLLLPNFPFSIIYREREGAIEVVALAHHRRRPGYWLER